MNAYLIFDYYLDERTSVPTIGGIQSYIYDLAVVLRRREYTINVLQMSRQDNKTMRYYSWNDMKIVCFPKLNGKINTYKKQVKEYLEHTLNEDDMVIFMTHTLNFPIKHRKTISIQHGIYWDIPYNRPRASEFIEFLFRSKHAWHNIRQINTIPNTVAVDYNFLNWYRTQQYYPRSRITVIPNYTEVPDRISRRDNDNVNILFARRMEKYRGAELFANVTARLLVEFQNCHFTFAGNGPELQSLKAKFNNNQRVTFTTFKHGESIEIHQKHQIAVVCSIGSEGTSLSLLEAMASGCAVIATNVGGMTNIILDGYNGLMVDANNDKLYNALKILITDKELRNRLSENAYQTAKNAFSKQQWELKWSEYLRNMEGKE